MSQPGYTSGQHSRTPSTSSSSGEYASQKHCTPDAAIVDTMGLTALGKPSGSDRHVKHIDDEQLIVQSLNTDGTPRRPMNAFMIFARRRRPQVSAANQAMRTGEISKILSREWAQMPMSEKEFYLDQAKRLKDVFNSRYPDYVYRRRPNNSRKKRKGEAGHELSHDGLSGDTGEDSSDATHHGSNWPSPEGEDFGRSNRHSDSSSYGSSHNDHGYSPYGHPSERYSAHQHTPLPPRLNFVPSQGGPATPRPPHPSHSPTILPSPASYPTYYASSIDHPSPAAWHSSTASHTWQQQPPPPPYPLRGQRSLSSMPIEHDPSPPPGRPFSAATSVGSPSTSSNASLHGHGLSSGSPYVSATTSPAAENFASSQRRSDPYYTGTYSTPAPYGHGYSSSSDAAHGPPPQLPRALSSHLSGSSMHHHSASDYAPGTLHHISSTSSGALWDRTGDR